jgi:hypothetical protein
MMPRALGVQMGRGILCVGEMLIKEALSFQLSALSFQLLFEKRHPY